MKKLFAVFIYLLLLNNLYSQVDVQQVGSLYNFWNHPSDYYVAGEYVFVVQNGAIDIYNILPDDKLDLLNRIEEHDFRQNTKLIDDYLFTYYYSAEESQFRYAVYDIADPTNPIKIKDIAEGSEPNIVTAVIDSNYAYSDNIKVWDITNILSPSLIYSSFENVAPNGYVYKIVNEKLIYRYSYTDGLGRFHTIHYSVDVSDPSNPVYEGPISGADIIKSSQMLNDTIRYNFTTNSRILILIENVSDPDNPLEISRILGGSGEYPLRSYFARIGSYLYARVNNFNIDTNRTQVRKQGDIYIINIGDPENPYLEKIYHPQADYNTYSQEPILIGNKVYALSSDAEFGIIDLSDPLNPTEVMTELSDDPYGSPISGVKIKGNYAFLQSNDKYYRFDGSPGFPVAVPAQYPAIRVVDISDPSNMVEVAIIDSVNMLDIEGDYIYCTSYDYSNYGFFTYDISDPSNPIRKSFFARPKAIIDFKVHNGFAYMALNGMSGNYIVDVSNAAQPKLINIFEWGPAFFDGNIMYSGSALHKFDMIDPANPVSLGSANSSITGGPANFELVGNYLYLFTVPNSARENNGGLRIWDISNYPNIVEKGSYNSISQGDYHYWTGSHALSAIHAFIPSDDGVHVLDINDANNPTLAVKIPVRGFKNIDVAFANNYVYTANEHTFEVFQIQLPSPPNEFNLLNPAGNITETTIDLLWEQTEDPNGTAVTYDVYLATKSDFTDQYKVAEGISDTTFHLTDLQVGQTYYWKVHALDDNTSGTWSSNVLNFTVQTTEVTLVFENDIGGETKGGVTTLDENTIYVPSSSKVVRLNGDGSLEYTLNVNGTIKSSSTITSDHTVYIASTDNNLYSFNSSGVTNPNWPVALGAEATASVAVGPNNNLYIGTSNGIYQAISREGAILWSYNVGAAVYSSSVISSTETLYVINANGRLYAFDLTTLDPQNVQYKWRLDLSEAVSSSPALDESGNLYVTTEHGKLLKVNDLGTSGNIEWTYDSGGNCESSPVIDGGLNIYFAGKEGKVFAVNGSTGNLIWDSETHYSNSNPDAILKASPTLSADGDRIYAGDSFGTVYGISTSTGEIIWSHKGTGVIEGPILAANNKIYFCAEGSVIALNEPGSLTKNSFNRIKDSAPLWPTFQGNPQRTGFNGHTIKSVSPLIQNNWTVFTWPYNAYLPEDKDGVNGHVGNACGYNSIARILHYWEFPRNGNGHLQFNDIFGHHWDCDLSSLNLDYSKMPAYLSQNATQSEYDETARLFLAASTVGEKIQVWSIGHEAQLPDAFKQYFNFKSTAKLVKREEHTRQQWIDIFTNELDNGRPIVVVGRKPDSPAPGEPGSIEGHWWICDGYNSDGKFYSNYAFGGIKGYYDIDSLGGVYIAYNRAVIGLEPDFDGKVLTLISPNGGETFSAGSEININWTSLNVSNIKIEYSSDNGSNWNLITASADASAKSYKWTAPSITSSNCKIRISDAGNSNIVAESFAVFKIEIDSSSGKDYFENYSLFISKLNQLTSSADSSAQLNTFWTDLIATGNFPFAIDTKVAFLYRGSASKINWAGMFNDWKTDADPGSKIGVSDIWLLEKEFPADTRCEYKIVRNGSEWLADPNNPHPLAGDYGNSELWMPDYNKHTELIERSAIAKGSLSGNLIINSSSLGYKCQYRVYSPAGYGGFSNLPVVYVADGQNYLDKSMGKMTIVLDNLIADGIIKPVIAVFLDPRDPNNLSNDRRGIEYRNNNNFMKYVTKEVIPAIDDAYKTNSSADARVIMGASYGGYNAAYFAVEAADYFQMFGINSAYLHPQGSYSIDNELQNANLNDQKFYLSYGTFDADGERYFNRLKNVLDQKGKVFESTIIGDGHTWQNWSRVIGDALEYFLAKPIGKENILALRQNDANGMPIFLDSIKTVTGIVTVSNEFGGSGPAYLQDDDAGVAIFGTSLVAQMTSGDSLTITAKVGFYKGLTELLDAGSSTNIVVHKNVSQPASQTVKIADILNQDWDGTELFEGKLLKIENVNITLAGEFEGDKNYFITDGTDTLTLRIDKDTDLAGTPIPTGNVDIVGCLGQFTSASPYSDGYQLLPRAENDIKVAQAEIVTILSPNGGENWTVGTKQNITWSGTITGNIKLEYSINNGSSWTEIVNSIPVSSGKYEWTIPNTASEQCKMRISSVSNTAVFDESDGTFTIKEKEVSGNYFGPYTTDANTILLLHFDGNTSNSSNLSADGVAHGGGLSYPNSFSSELNNCLRINNSDFDKTCISVPHSSSLNLTDDWTIEAWVKVNQFGSGVLSYPIILSKPGDNDFFKPNYSIIISKSYSAFRGVYFSTPDNNTYITSPQNSVSNQWVHIAFIRDTEKKMVKLLIHDSSGALVSESTYEYNPSTSAPTLANGNDLQIGGVSNSSNIQFDGFIDEVRISNVVRTFEPVTNVIETPLEIVTEYKLSQNYPNPFNPTTKIAYSLPESGPVTLKVYDALGNEVRTLVNEEKSSGVHTVQFDASRLSSGIYFYRLIAGKYYESKKMLLLK